MLAAIALVAGLATPGIADAATPPDQCNDWATSKDGFFERTEGTLCQVGRNRAPGPALPVA